MIKNARVGITWIIVIGSHLSLFTSSSKFLRAFDLQPLPLPYKGKQGRRPKRTGYNLLFCLLHYKQDVLRFLNDPAVPFTHNDAERDLRMAKCKQKISGGFRSVHGANQFARIRGFISTTRNQGWNILQSIQSIFANDIPVPV